MVSATPGAGEMDLMIISLAGFIAMYSGIVLMAYHKHIKPNINNAMKIEKE